MNLRSLYKLLALLLAFAMLTAACGSDDDEGGDAATETDSDADADEADDEADDDVIEADTVAEDAEETEVTVDDSAKDLGGELIIGLEAEFPGLRPWEDACSSPCMNVFTAIYDKLMETTADGGYEGWLLESISSNDDFTAWTGTLRPGVTFHDGKELTAQSIADMFPVQQAGAISAGFVASSNLANVEATGELEVTWTLSQPNSAFPAFLARAPLGMVFDAELAADPDAGNERANGTGAFMFVSRDLDNETILERNPSYWMSDKDGNQLPYLDRLVFRPIPDEGTRLDATLSGTTQVAHTLRGGTIRDARDARDGGAEVALYEYQGSTVSGGLFNVLVAPFDDVRVRRGLTLLQPQEQVIAAAGGEGLSLPGTQWFSPDSPWYSEAVAAAWPSFDFEAGVATLQDYIDDPARSDGKAAGEPIDVDLSCPPDPTLLAAMQVIEQVWTESGLVNVTLSNFDQGTHIGIALGGENGFVGSHGAHCWRFSNDEDPSTTLNSAFAPPTAEIAAAAGMEGVVSPVNFTNYFSAEMFGSLVAATRTADPAERYALYEAVMLEIAEQVPHWLTGHTPTALVTHPSVMGLASWELPNGSLGAGLPNAEGRWSQAWVAVG